MADLDAEFALFEQEIASLEATSSTPANENNQPPIPQPKVTITAAPVKTPKSYNVAKSAATITQAPALYKDESAALTQPPSPPKILLPLQQDVEHVTKKRLTSKAQETSYLGQVLRGEKKMKRFVRTAGGQTWEDPSLAEWDEDDFRIFCGDLGNEVNDLVLANAFRKYPSFQKAKVVRDHRSNKSKGYGFVSFRTQEDYVLACREMDGKYVGNRPIKLKKSTHKDRDLRVVRKKNNEKKKLGLI
uniref:RNA-binding protein 42 n=1 Tax=Panagrellus redivivus TaxID=6233 RepID=A0A7E4UZW4_PANRE